MNCESKKIFFCLGSMGRGGAERVVANLANYFIEKNDVSIIVTKHSELGYELNKKINYIVLDKANECDKNVLSRTIVRIHRLRKFLKNKSPDIVVSFLPEPSYRLMVAKTFLRVKTIVSVRNDPNTEYSNLLKKLLVRLLYTRADGFVFQTPDAKRWFSKKIQRRSAIILNPIDKKFLRKCYDGKRDNRIVTVGRVVEQKNQKLLVNAFCRFCKNHSRYKLEIYGDGPMREELQKYIDQSGIKNSVKIMGEVSNIEEKIYKAKMFVLTSDYEGMPNALMEAMVLGIPCISTDCSIGGPRYLIENGVNGLLVDVGDVNGIALGMGLIADDERFADTLSSNARSVAKRIDPDKVFLEWDNYIMSVMRSDNETIVG